MDLFNQIKAYYRLYNAGKKNEAEALLIHSPELRGFVTERREAGRISSRYSTLKQDHSQTSFFYSFRARGIPPRPSEIMSESPSLKPCDIPRIADAYNYLISKGLGHAAASVLASANQDYRSEADLDRLAVQYAFLQNFHDLGIEDLNAIGASIFSRYLFMNKEEREEAIKALKCLESLIDDDDEYF